MKKINVPVRYCIVCKNPILRNTKNSRIRPKQYMKAKFCSVKCRGKWQSINNVGKNSSNYRGGKTVCVDCGKTLDYRYSYRNTTRCRECWTKVDITGVNSPNWKGGISIPRHKTYPKCKICGGKTGDRYSKICKKCYRGKNHPLWKGGTSKLSALIRILPQYRKWYLSVFKRDDYTCQKCGKNRKNCYKGNLSAHHLKQFAIILKENKIKSLEQAINCKELWNVDNGLTLCIDCHKKTDSYCKKI